MDIFEIAELFVEELDCEGIQKAARILRSNQQPVADGVSRELFKPNPLPISCMGELKTFPDRKHKAVTWSTVINKWLVPSSP